jgi:cytochrome c peroxidase
MKGRCVKTPIEHRRPFGWLAVATAAAGTIFAAEYVKAQTADPPVPPPLSTVPVPTPSNLSEFVVDQAKAIVLGKALFWDMQVGSDGVQACASCHFRAGADSRAKNQLSPGLQRVSGDGSPNPDYSTHKGHNYTLALSDFPFRLLSNPNDRTSAVVRDTNDIAGSQGVKFRKFLYVIPGVPIDATLFMDDPDGFKVNGLNVRRVEPRHTPTVINAVFNHRQFWDGRAQNVFNGVNPFGARDPHARVFRADDPNVQPLAVQISIPNASLASQAVGPPVSNFEMSADGRTFVDIGEKFSKPMRESGKKLQPLRPLGQQQVHPQDSVLGPYSRYPQNGLTYSRYDDLIKEAFAEKWWRSNWQVRIESDGSRTLCNPCSGNKVYSVMQMNFSMFFGLAVQLYEATLVSDQTPFDAFAGGNQTAMSDSAVRGLNLFRSQTRGRCINCHGGPETTNNAVRIIEVGRFRRREGNYIDQGFNNIGLRPTTEDLAVGANDPFGTPLSEARLVFLGQFPNPQPPPAPTDTLGVDGAFKVPGIRNVELTAPYFHNGGSLTLREVIEFYSRGGDFVPITSLNGQTISPLNTPNFTEQEKDDLVAFLLALTDERVRYRQAPFDHPSLTLPNGHTGNQNTVYPESLLELNQAQDRFVTIGAVGAGGGSPLPPFPWQ